MHDDFSNELPDDLKKLWEKLDSIPGETADSPAMKVRFNAMLDAYQENVERSQRTWWPLRPAVQFVAAVLLLATGLAVGRYLPQTRPQPPNADLDQLRREVVDLREIVALSLMQQQSATDRLRGVSWSNQIDEPDGKVVSALLDTLMHDPNINVRLASIDALRRFGERQVVRSGALQALAQQESPLVQVALIDFMVDLQEKESIETLQKMAEDNRVDGTVRKRAALGIQDFQQR
jgi:HEAT repeat protein